MDPANPEFRDRTRRVFEAQPALRALGMELSSIEPGSLDCSLRPAERHMQQHGHLHAGVVATLADTAGGLAAFTLMPAGVEVNTSGFSIHFLRPARGDRITARGRVLKPGRRLVVADVEVVARRGGEETLVAKATVTAIPLPHGTPGGPAPIA